MSTNPDTSKIKAGRLYEGPPHTVRMPDDLWEYCKQHGKGNAPEFIRNLIRTSKEITDHSQKTTRTPAEQRIDEYLAQHASEIASKQDQDE